MLFTLKKYFGFKSFRPGQEEIINAILANESVLAILPTGGGKSLCYQIPSLLCENFAIVISPLIALMKDQVDSLNKKEQVAEFINSSLDYYETEMILNSLSERKIKLLYVAPERLENKTFAERIKNLKPSFIFVDEAHCISEWGHNFRPSYRKIKEFIEYTQVKTVSAFTATATPEVEKDIVLQLGMKHPKIFVKGFERDNLFINVLQVKNKFEKIIELLNRFGLPAIIYTATRKSAEDISRHLLNNKIDNSFYHAGISNIQRKKIQENFIQDKIGVIVATNAFGMGIDKKDIRIVIHFNMPGSIENFYQEIGRAGRDSKNSYTYMLFDKADINIQQYFINSSFPDKELIRSVYDAICNLGQVAINNLSTSEIPIKIDFISVFAKRDISKGLLSASLKILEESGYIKIISELEKRHQLKVLIDRNHLKNFVKNLNNHFKQSLVLHLVRAFGGSIFRDNIEISLNNISNELGISEKEIDDMLLELNNSGVVDYIRPLEKESIRLLKPRIDSKRLEINYKRLNDSYINAQKKLDKIIEFVYSKDCRFKVILDYFGEDVTNHRCGKCDNCTNDVSQTDKTFEYLQEIILKTVYENKDGITNTNLINLLTGKSRSNILNKFSTFGICSNYSKNEIEHVIQNLISFGQLKRRLQGGKKIILANRGKDFLAEKSLIENEDKNIDYEKTLELFHILREVRTKAANKFNQPKYLVCSDELLRKIATLQPKTKFEMLSIKGFSERMYNKVGEEFLSKISEFSESESSGLFECEEKAKADITSERLPENILETYKLINQGFNLNEIAVLRNLSEAVISMQIESILFYKPELDISKLVDDATIASVKKYFDDGLKELKVIKEKLGNSVNYSQLRIILAKFKSSPTSS